MHDFSAIYHNYRLTFSEEEQCNPPIRKFWSVSSQKCAALYFVSRSHVITSASRAKEPLVSQLLHSEQAPKWCIIISTIPVRLYFQSCSSNQQRKIPITIKLRSWFYPAHACVIYHFGVIKQRGIRKEIDRKLCSDTNEWSYHVERENIWERSSSFQCFEEYRSTGRCYFAVRAHDAVFGAAKNLEELTLAQLFSPSR